jgi:SAM-dependent methyltransferase
MYSVADFGRMIEDETRMDAFRRAIAGSVTPESVVIDLGAGTGIMALIACRHGAKRVYAIDPSDAIQLGREAAAANGYADRIVFIQDRSDRVTLPEKADLIVEDMGGVLPWFGTHLLDVIDARERLLAPGGRIISRSVTVFAALIEDDALYRERMEPWSGGFDGLDLRAGMRYASCSPASHALPADAMRSEPRALAEIIYLSVRSPHAHGKAVLEVTRAGVVHGLALWFEPELVPGIRICNAPGNDAKTYGQRFFPWPEPVSMQPGDRVELDFRANLVGRDYVYAWSSRIEPGPSGRTEAVQFRQSTFASMPLTPESLARRAANARPELNTEGQAVRFVLERMGGAQTLEEISRLLAQEFPDRFRQPSAAFEFVARLSGEYGL